MSHTNENGLIVVNKIAKKINRLHEESVVRKTFLEELTTLMAYDFGVFDICSINNDRITLVEPMVKSKYDKVFERRFLYDYDTKYAGMSYSRWIHNEKRTLFLRDSDLVNDHIRQSSRYYREYISGYGFEYVLNCEYVDLGVNIASLTLYRSKKSGDFTEEDIYYMELLAPCIIHAFKDSHLAEQNTSDNNCLEKFNLTKREKEVINLVYESKSNREIGDQLFISENTVKKHLYNVFGKMNIKNREKLISYLHSRQYREY